MMAALLELGLGCGVGEVDAVGNARAAIVALEEMEVELLVDVVRVEIDEDCVVVVVDNNDDDNDLNNAVVREELEEMMLPCLSKATPVPCWQQSG